MEKQMSNGVTEGAENTAMGKESKPDKLQTNADAKSAKNQPAEKREGERTEVEGAIVTEMKSEPEQNVAKPEKPSDLDEALAPKAPASAEATAENSDDALSKQNVVEEANKKPEVGTKQWYEEDKRAFLSEFSQQQLSELMGNGDFLDYADGKAGLQPLAEIYKGYTKLVGKIEEQANERAERRFAERQAKAKASPGSLTENSTASDSGLYSLEELRRMSPEYIERHWDKVTRSVQSIKKK